MMLITLEDVFSVPNQSLDCYIDRLANRRRLPIDVTRFCGSGNGVTLLGKYCMIVCFVTCVVRKEDGSING